VEEEGEAPGGFGVVGEEGGLGGVGAVSEGAADFVFVGAEVAARLVGDGVVEGGLGGAVVEEGLDGGGPAGFEGGGDGGEDVGEIVWVGGE
jgi:hypothetical protein